MIEELSRFNQTASRPLGLKVGVHRGRAIAVRLNDRIDYFGQDVNIAARVQGLAGVNEVCLTEAVMEAPGVSDIVKGRPASRDYENLKGIGQKMEIHRIEISPAQR
jgi:class 3 adenylate cyclase